MAHGATERLHATAIDLSGRGALILGPSGSGKSDLALRCLAGAATPYGPAPALLVADDQVVLRRDGTALFASAPATIAGKIEVRGLGIYHVPFAAETTLVLAVRLVDAREVPRLPDPRPFISFLDHPLPLILLDPTPPSASTKLLLALANGLPVD